jgi:hypothetical protein
VSEAALPLCASCIDDRVAGYPVFRDEEKARELAHGLHLVSGDIWTAVNIMLQKKEGLFL